ncbi:MAG: hypothetical protein QXG39_05465 [Candidatus Aenigmatarchaeota archaeon]
MIIEIKAYNDPWMDNALENFYRTLKSFQSCESEIGADFIRIKIRELGNFINELWKTLEHKKKNMIVIEVDEKTKTQKEVKKDYVIIQEEKKIGGKVAFKEEIYKSEKAKEIIDEIFSSEEGENRCILCERPFKKSVKKLQQANYPFVTKIASLSGIRSYKDGFSISLKEYYDNLCPWCYFIGIFEWTDDGFIYRTFPGEKSLVFLPQFGDLKTLHMFKEKISNSGILDFKGRYSNIKVSVKVEEFENTPGEFSTLLCFYEKFVEISQEENLISEWVVLEVPFGAVKNIKTDFVKISSGILNIIRNLKESGRVERIYSDIIKKILFFSSKINEVEWEITREIQEEVSSSFLTDDFRSFTRTLMPKKGGYVVFSSEVRKNLEELIFEWRWKNMGVPKENLDSIRSVGNIVAKISKNNASLLYKLDKTRTINEFWSVMREISRKLVGLEEEDLKMVKPTAIDELIQLTKEITEKGEKDSWKEVRDLIVVYASIFYSIDKMSKTQQKVVQQGGE